ncbi:MAG TPA: nucleoside monophosphate kinase [Bryobacteraceae bacterium]
MPAIKLDTFSPAVILFGSPGSGKGTQAKLLQNCLRGPHISTGDMLRDHITAGDEIGKEAQRLIRTGNLVPDEMVNSLVRERLAAPDCRQGIILDGYPRTINQASVLLDMMKEDGIRPAVVHLMVDYEKIVARLSGRRQCPVCKTLYSLKTNPPKVAGICDLDGTALVTREDDREPVIRERLREYDLQTLPILEFFRKAGVPVIEMNAGYADPDRIGRQICDELVRSGLIPAVPTADTGATA